MVDVDCSFRLPSAGGGDKAPEFVTLKESAMLARVDVRTIQRWISSGRLRVGRGKGRTLRIRRAEVLRAIEGDFAPARDMAMG